MSAVVTAHGAGVAPHAGAWIETYLCFSGNALPGVAPHAGAWIETKTFMSTTLLNRVAPHAGEWIETYCLPLNVTEMGSPPMRGRGLKQPGLGVGVRRTRVAPHAGAWIETKNCQ